MTVRTLPAQPAVSGPTRGFTLLEMLIALSIFAVLSVIAYSGLRSVIQVRSGIEAAAQELRRLQVCLVLLERDLVQIVPRPGRDEYGDRRPALVLDSSPTALTFGTVGAGLDPALSPTGLQRVEYRLRDRQLVRRVWRTLDLGEADPMRETVLLDGVKGLSFEALDDQGAWQQSWLNTRVEPQDLDRLPRAIRVVIDLERMRGVMRLFPLGATS